MKEKIIEWLDKYIENLKKLKEVSEKGIYETCLCDNIHIFDMDNFDELCKILELKPKVYIDEEKGYTHKTAIYKGYEIVSVKAPEESANSL